MAAQNSPTNQAEVGPAVEVGVLGPVSLRQGEEQLPVGGPKQQAVLAMLAARAGDVVSADLIAQALYGEDAPDRARRRVQTYVSNLRSVVGDLITRTGPGWSLSADARSIDAQRFEDACAAAEGLAPREASAALRDALAMWRGRAYAHIEAHGFLDGEISRLDELRVKAQTDRIRADLATGRHADLIAEIEVLLVEHPYRETFRSLHMLALYRAGRQREALGSYAALRATLVEDLGIDPSQELRDLELRIIEQDPELTLPEVRSVHRRAVLVVDTGDPLMPAPANDNLSVSDQMVLSRGEVHPAGAAVYGIFESVELATTVARDVALGPAGESLRSAIDWGDIETTDRGISGQPVARAALLVSHAHQGQVLLSPAARDELVGEPNAERLQLGDLGPHRLANGGPQVTIYELVVGEPARTFPPLETRGLPPPLPEAGIRSVAGFELRQPVGFGGAGELYRAYQPSVGREVMVEIVRAPVANTATFIREFEPDAQRLSLLDHPHLNPLLDYWRDPDGAYLVHRYHRGGFLASSGAATPALLRQIASALAYLHRYELVHGAVRPDRVLLDESGNGYLTGFSVGPRPTLSESDDRFMAPEVSAGAPPTARSDVYSIAVFAQDLVAAGHLDGPGLDDLLLRATDADPEARPDSIEELLVALEPGAAPKVPARSQIRNPYKGLAAFQESDAADFFGRSAMVDQLVAAVDASTFVAVVGPSGIGKSSLVRAGLLPALREGPIAGSSSWTIAEMMPGAHPFHELRRALERVAVSHLGQLAGLLADRDADALADVAPYLPVGSELLLVIDQFEELFTMCGETEAAAFMELIVRSVDEGHARFLITLRADFLDRPLMHSTFGGVLRDHLLVVPAPDPSELVEAVVGPARAVGLSVDNGLVERITTDVLDRPGALPLLQHTLAAATEARTSDTLDLAAYERVGGLLGSMARRADGIVDRLAVDEQGRVRQAFLQLVSVSDDGATTRRRVPRGELERSLAPESIDEFVGARLLVSDNDPETHTPTIEVAHEALLRGWPRLSEWIDTYREELLLRDRLQMAVTEWAESGESDDQLLVGGRLHQHENWVAASGIPLTEDQNALLARSRVAEDHRARDRQRRRQLFMGLVTLAAVVAGILALVAFQQSRNANSRRAEALSAESVAQEQAALAETERDRAEANAAEAEAQAAEVQRQRDIAEGRALLAALPQTLLADPQEALALAIGAAERLGEVAAVTTALHEVIGAQPTIANFNFESEVPLAHHRAANVGGRLPRFNLDGDISPDGRLVALVGAFGNTVELHRVDTAELVWSHTFDAEPAVEHRLMARFANGGEQLVIGVSWHPSTERAFADPSEAVGFHVLDVSTGTVLHRYDSGPCGPVAKATSAWGAINDMSRVGALTMTVSPGWHADFGCAAADPSVADEAAGEWRAATIDVEFFDFATGERSPVIVGWSGGPVQVAVSFDGRVAAYTSTDQPVSVLDVGTREVRATVASAGPEIALDADGSSLAAYDRTAGVLVYDLVPGGGPLSSRRLDVELDLGWVWFVGEESDLLTSSADGELGLYDGSTLTQVARIDAHRSIWLVRSTPDASRIAGFGPRLDDPLLAATFEPGHGLAEVDGGEIPDGIECDDIGWPEGMLPCGPPGMPPNAIAISTDGTRIVVAEPFEPASGRRGIMRLYDGRTFELLTETSVSSETVVPNRLAFVGDSGAVAAVVRRGEEWAVRVHDAGALQPTRRIQGPHDFGLEAGASNAGEFEITSLAVTPDGTRIATTGVDGFVRIWAYDTLALLHEIPVAEPVIAGAFVDDRRFAVATASGTRTYWVDFELLLDEARRRLTEPMAQDFCLEHFGVAGCPGLPSPTDD